MEGRSSSAPDADSIIRNRSFIGLLALAAVVGLIASLAAWCFLELVHQTQTGVFDELPNLLGFERTPIWWPLPVLGLAGVIVAFAVARLPGAGGHIPVRGLDATPSQPIDLPGVVLAAVAGIGLGIVLGPEAPLIAVGGGLGFLAVRVLAGDAPPEVGTLVATAGIFAAISFLFGSPVIAAVLLVEAAGLDRSRLTLVLIPGLLAAGIGSLVSTGMGSWTGLDTADIELSPLQLPEFARPELVDFLWTIALAVAVAVVTHLIFRIGRGSEAVASRRPFLVLPLVGLAVAGLAIGFAETTDHGVEQVLFSGEEQLNPLIAAAGSWSLGALALLIVFKGIAYGLALGSFRGGPVFPALFLGATAGLMAAELPGFDLTPAVAVGMGAAVVAVLRLPLSAVVLAVLLTSSAGLGSGALIILGVVVSYLVTVALPGGSGESAPPADPATDPPAPATA